MIRVLLVDDQRLVRAGIRKILESDDGMEVVAETGVGEVAVRLAEEHNPDVALIAASLPELGSIETTRRILECSHAKVVLLMAEADGPMPQRLLDTGAAGFVTRASHAQEMLEVIRRVAAGERYLSVDIARSLAEEQLSGTRNPFDLLSQRELQVALMVTQGYAAQKIATLLDLSPKTVSTYRSRIFHKLDVESNVDLVRLAYRHGLLESDTPHKAG